MWANTSNTPFRYWKKEQYEGGIATPLIVHWPEGITIQDGTIVAHPGHVIDIFPTALELAMAKHPTTYNGMITVPLEGRSLVPLFEGKKLNDEPIIYWEHYGSRAVRRGDWKLVALQNGPWELYNLAQDRTETKNLAAEHTQTLLSLRQLWLSWASRTQVLPTPK